MEKSFTRSITERQNRLSCLISCVRFSISPLNSIKRSCLALCFSVFEFCLVPLVRQYVHHQFFFIRDAPREEKAKKNNALILAIENLVLLPSVLKSLSYFCKFALFNSFLILDPPSITSHKICDMLVEGDNITLTCNTSGKPQPVITWTKLGSSEVLSNTSSLTIVNVSRPGTSDNMIQYQCTASNGVETPATATVNCSVHCK